MKWYEVSVKIALHFTGIIYMLVIRDRIAPQYFTLDLLILYLPVFIYDMWTYWPEKGRVNDVEDRIKSRD